MTENKEPQEVKITVMKVSHPNPEKLTDPTYFDPMLFSPTADEFIAGSPGKGKTKGKK